jgi:hypothetical protein
MNAPAVACANRRYSLRLASKAHTAAVSACAAAVSAGRSDRVTRSGSGISAGAGRPRRSARLAGKPRVCYEGMDCEECD